MRPLLCLALVGMAACSNPADKKKADPIDRDTGDPGQLPPTSCPVGDLALTKADLANDELMFQRWNEIRVESGSCGGVPMDAASTLAFDESLAWVARCWAYDLSLLGGPPPASDQFSDTTTLEQAATDMGFAGFVHTWAVVGNVAEPPDAFVEWLAGGGDTCESLWADSTVGAAAWSDAGDLLVAVRITGLDVR